MSIDAGYVTVLSDGTYVGQGLALRIFEPRYALVVGDLVLPTSPPATPIPPVTLAMLIYLLQQEAQKAGEAARKTVGDFTSGASAFPIADDANPPSGGLVVTLTQSGGTMTGTPTIDIDGTAFTITRSGGSGAKSWLVDGFHVGQIIAIGVSSGSSLNTAFTGAIAKVTPTKLYFGFGLSSESGKTNLVITSSTTTIGSLTKNSLGLVV
jgi:hypothetical protein